MKALLTLIFLSLFVNLSSQDSYLYNKFGHLRVDTSLSIDLNRIKEISDIEKYILPTLYNRLDYPLTAIENNLQGICIIKLMINKKDKTIETQTIKSIHTYIDKQIISILDSLKSNILYVIDTVNEMDLNLYIPVIFEIENDFYENGMRESGAVIKKSTSIAKQRSLIRHKD
jgi:hypothetical protein